MELVRPDIPATWRNHPAPLLPQWMHDELLLIAGTNSYGQPNLRFAWGQEREQFRINRMRLLYIDTRIPALEHKRYTFKKLLLETPERVHVGTNQQTGEMIFEERTVKKYDTIVLDHPPGAGDIIPAGYLFDQEYPELEWIGEQLWYVEQYIPADKILGGVEEWERHRFSTGTNPDTGVDETLDWLGEFPSEGRFQSVHAIGHPAEYLEHVKEPVVVEEGYRLRARRMPDGQMCTVREPRLRWTGEYESVPKIRQSLTYEEPNEETFAAIREAWSDRNNKTLTAQGVKSGVRFYEYQRAVKKKNEMQRAENKRGVEDILKTLTHLKGRDKDYEKVLAEAGSPVRLSRHDRRRQATLEKRGRLKQAA